VINKKYEEPISMNVDYMNLWVSSGVFRMTWTGFQRMPKAPKNQLTLISITSHHL
jgi:hypothetical protein